MADGKVMQKYYPPDFDPELLKKNKELIRYKRRRGLRLMDMRMMYPFTLCCGSCRDFVYVGTKFNAKVERIMGEDYLGIPIWRFYGRCPHCRSMIIFRTDPKNTDYILESGGYRTYDANRDSKLAEEKLREEEAELEKSGDQIRVLESKSYVNNEEFKSIKNLENLKKMNKKLLNKNQIISRALENLQAQDEKLIEDMFQQEARDLFLDKQYGTATDVPGNSDSWNEESDWSDSDWSNSEDDATHQRDQQNEDQRDQQNGDQRDSTHDTDRHCSDNHTPALADGIYQGSAESQTSSHQCITRTHRHEGSGANASISSRRKKRRTAGRSAATPAQQPNTSPAKSGSNLFQSLAAATRDLEEDFKDPVQIVNDEDAIFGALAARSQGVLQKERALEDFYPDSSSE